MKLQLNGSSYQISLPSAIVKAKNWEVGMKLRAELDNKGNIVIKEAPKEVYLTDTIL